MGDMIYRASVPQAEVAVVASGADEPQFRHRAHGYNRVVVVYGGVRLTERRVVFEDRICCSCCLLLKDEVPCSMSQIFIYFLKKKPGLWNMIEKTQTRSSEQ